MRMRLALTLTLVAALVYVGVCLALYVFQRSLLYFPQPRSGPTVVMPLYSGANEPQVLVSVHDQPGADAVIYFGGNAEDVSLNLPPLRGAFPEHALYLLHYRGYGGSDGHPTEALIVQDALALFDRVQRQHPKVLLIGRSLGSGVAVQVAAQRTVQRLVLVTPYDSILGVASDLYAFVPVRWLLTHTFDSGRHVAQVTAPVVLITAERDSVIPRESTERLFRRFPADQATMTVLPGTSHNDIGLHPDYPALLNGSR